MEKVRIYSKLHKLEYKTPASSGADLRACFITENCVTLQPGEIRLIPTGIFLELPIGLEAQVRSRSGLAKNGIVVANSPGTVDSDYRGEVGVLLENRSRVPFTIIDGDRIAQLVIAPYVQPQFDYVGSPEDLSETERGQGGFGHTGVK